MRISKSGKQVFPEKSGFCGKFSTPAHVRFFPKPFISFASAQLRLRRHSLCARRLQPEVADRKPGGCERPRSHNPRAVVTGFKIYMRCARRTVPPGRKLAHKWLFIEKLRRSLARSLASNAVVFTNREIHMDVGITESENSRSEHVWLSEDRRKIDMMFVEPPAANLACEIAMSRWQ